MSTRHQSPVDWTAWLLPEISYNCIIIRIIRCSDGASKIPDLVKRAKELNMPAVGITDHGNMHGAYEMWSTAVKEGVKPIIGIEAYVTPETARQDQTRVSWDTNWNPDIDPSIAGATPTTYPGGAAHHPPYDVGRNRRRPRQSYESVHRRES